MPCVSTNVVSKPTVSAHTTRQSNLTDAYHSDDQEGDPPRAFIANSFKGPINPYDAQVVLARPPWVFTSPNLGEIPFVEVQPTSLYARADGRFGIEDYVLWPQAHSEAYPWAPCVLRKPRPAECHGHTFWFLWVDINRNDWVAPPGASWQRTGVLRDELHFILQREFAPITSRALSASRHQPLPIYVSSAVNALHATLARLRDLPMSYRDLVLQFTQAQRLGLDLLAMEDYHARMFSRMMQRRRVYPLRPELMGCHTTNPTTVENMHHAGIPVVYMRSSNLLRPSQLRVRRVLSNFAAVPPDIVTDPWPKTPCRVLHEGASGGRRMQMSRPHGRYFEDLPALPDVQEELPDMRPFLLQDPLRPTSSARDDEPECFTVDDGAMALPTRSPSPPQRTASASQRTVTSGGIAKAGKKSNSRKARKGQHRSRPLSTPICPQTPHLPSQAARNKWAIPASDLMPPVCTEWRAALAAVNRGVKCRTLLSKARAGLMFPDPSYVVSIADANRALVITAWLSIRPARCGQMLYPSSPMMPVIPASVWRQFFWIYRRRPRTHADLSVPPADTGDPAIDTDLDAATAAAKAMFGPDLVSMMNKSLRQVFWRDTAYDVIDGAVVGMGPQQVREIVWELAELNWRYELMTMDKYAAPHMWLDSDAAADHISSILLVFGPSSSFVLTNAPFPTSNLPIAATTRAERLKAFTALRRVMCAWVGCPTAIKEAVSDYVPSGSDCPETRVVEAQTMLFYCQSFYEYFRRPPILPCQLPSS